MARYTVCTLRSDVDKINDWLAKDSFTTRLTTGGRNGYQAIDEYSVDEDGNRIGSGVNRNVCAGSSRECGEAAHDYYNAESRRRDRDELEAFRAAVLKQENSA